jgi:hypothetical protein
VRQNGDVREKTNSDVEREPTVSYKVSGYFDDGEEERAYESETRAFSAARMMVADGATDVRVTRWTTRLVHDREELDWRG